MDRAGSVSAGAPAGRGERTEVNAPRWTAAVERADAPRQGGARRRRAGAFMCLGGRRVQARRWPAVLDGLGLLLLRLLEFHHRDSHLGAVALGPHPTSHSSSPFGRNKRTARTLAQCEKGVTMLASIAYTFLDILTLPFFLLS